MVEEQRKAGPRQWASLVVLMLPVLLVSVNNTALSFALPAISQGLHPTASQLLWIVDVYPLILAALLIPMGSLGDRMGRRKMLMIGSTGFGLVSLFAAFAPSAEWLLAARVGIAVFGSMLLPTTLSLLRTVFRDDRQRSLAIAIWTAGFSAGAALGPIAGGFLLNHFWWGSVFLLAVPVLLAFLVAAPLILPESKDPHPGPVDPLSIVLAVLTMAPVVYGIKSLATGGSVLHGVLFMAVGALCGLLFARQQVAKDYPMLDLRFFRSPRFSGGLSVNMMSNVALFGFLFFFTQYLQLVNGTDPMTSGLLMVPGLVLSILAGLGAERIARLVGIRTAVVLGLLLVAAGFFIVAFTDQTSSAAPILVAFTVMSAGTGLATTLSTDLVVSSVPEAKAGAASAVSETGYEVGAVLGTAVLGGLTTAFYQAHLELPAAVSADSAQIAHETLGGALDVAADSPAGSVIADAAVAAFSSGMQWTALIGGVLMAVVALVLARVLRADRRVRRVQG
ncbi:MULTISPECIES: MFS transporter [Kocuria]|uniref:MFS transporter n=1 Tax=Kocuria TaxID=57493 RepID=UPI001CB9CAB3|nr:MULTISPECIES: MFS transporter [Kocuria]MCT1545342.1 MFS transporter [Kocuria rhizophila]MCT1956898.1 MFS transporter [Kocuria rhizophila]MCT2073325.1 MFS transporter [Kocuria rhizophila]MCT2171539.1 MFS transporter [Kocuria rhizophila]MDN3461966.1 MFS transporter [Kocuria sp. APC 4018]